MVASSVGTMSADASAGRALSPACQDAKRVPVLHFPVRRDLYDLEAPAHELLDLRLGVVEGQKPLMLVLAGAASEGVQDQPAGLQDLRLAIE